MPTPNGVVVYRGPSRIDGKPIVAIATGLKTVSTNAKTGPMVQVYILADNTESPLDNAQSGQDHSVCGNCLHRAKDGKLGSCYVNVGRGPNEVYGAFLRGNYPTYVRQAHARLFRGRSIRFGAYGDPAAVPIRVWHMLARLTSHWTAYTHQWQRCSRAYARYCMASVETEALAAAARAKGYRTFRTRLPEQPVAEAEIVCPASAEAGKRRTCETCRACRGAGTGKSVVIVVHGWANKVAKYRRALTVLS